MGNTQNKSQSYHRKTSGPPPEKGPNSQGLNLKYNSVKTVKLTEKINGRHRQGSTKRA
jgi:hypothetical protein